MPVSLKCVKLHAGRKLGCLCFIGNAHTNVSKCCTKTVPGILAECENR